MALSIMGTGGSQMMSQINFRIGTRGVVTGANIMKMQMDRIDTTARRTAKRLGTVGDAATSMSQQLTQASAAMAGVGFGLITLGKKINDNFTKPALDGAEAFEVAMGRITFATGATGKELERLERIMIDVGLKTTETPISAANAFADLRSAGMDTAESLELLPKVIQMTTGSRGLLSMDQAIRTTISAVSKFRHTGQPFAKTMDDIAQATRVTALNWQHMPAFFNALRDSPKKLKATTSEMLALGGAMKMGGMQAAESAQAIALWGRKMIDNQRKLGAYMAKKGLTEEEFFKMDPKELPRRMIQFQKFGVSLFDAAGKMRPLNDVLVDTMSKMQELGKESDEAQAVVMSGAFGDKGTSVISMLDTLTKKGESFRDAIERMTGSVDKSNGVLKQAEDAFLKTTAGLKKLKEGTEDTILIVMGKTMLPVLEKVVWLTKSILDSFLKFLDANPRIAKALSWTIALIGGLAIAIGTATLAMAAFLMYQGMLKPAIKNAGGALSLLKKSFSSLRQAIIPTLISIGAVIALFGLLYLAISNWKSIRAFVAPIADTLIEIFTNIKLVAMGLVEWWNGTGGPNSMKLFEQLDKRNLTGIVGFLLQVKTKITAVFEGILDVVVPVLKGMFAAVKFVLIIVGKLLEVLGILPKMFGTEDLTNSIGVYRVFGMVLGFVASVLGLIFLSSLMGAVKGLVVFISTINIALIKVFLLKVAIIALIVIYFLMISKFMEWGEQLGNVIFESVDKISFWFNYMLEAFSRIGEGIVQWLRQGVENGWDGFVKWFLAQIDFLVTKGLSFFGLKSEEEVRAAWEKATEGVSVDMNITADDVEERERGQSSRDARSDQRRRIAELAARSRTQPMTGPVSREGDELAGAMALAGGQSEMGAAETTPRIGKIDVIIQGNATKEDALAIAEQTAAQVQRATDREKAIGFK